MLLHLCGTDQSWSQRMQEPLQGGIVSLRPFSETEVVTDSENVSESNTDGFSDGNTDNPANDFDILRVRDCSSQHRFINKNGATEKIATVCNEIKQRFQPDLTNTDDE